MRLTVVRAAVGGGGGHSRRQGCAAAHRSTAESRGRCGRGRGADVAGVVQYGVRHWQVPERCWSRERPGTDGALTKALVATGGRQCSSCRERRKPTNGGVSAVWPEGLSASHTNLAVADRRDVDVVPKLVCIIDAAAATAEDTWYPGYSHSARLLPRAAAAVASYERCGFVSLFVAEADLM